jgi:uncharacterized protein YjdB/C1A family cysteine protease
MIKKTRKIYKTLAGVLTAALLMQGSVMYAADGENAETGTGVVTGTTGVETDDAAAEEVVGTEEISGDDYGDGYILAYHGEDDPEVDPIDDIPQACLLDDELSAEGVSDIPESYNASKDSLSYITSVKNQGDYGTCWAFATCAAAEADIYKKYNTEVDLSEWQLAYFTVNEAAFGITDTLGGTAGDGFYTTGLGNYLTIGGNQLLSIKSLASWKGLTLEENASYDTVLADSTAELASELAYGSDAYHLKNAYIINMKSLSTIKKMIMEYGACGTAYYQSSANYNSATNAEYCATKMTATNHAITIVGWDDNFSKENFNTEPENDGAWYVKNSWGEGKNDGGYFWLSYEDANLSSGFFYDMVKADDDYTYNYQYDGGSYSPEYYTVSDGYTTVYEANVFTANTNEDLKAIGFYTNNTGYKCTMSIYTEVDDGEYMSENCVLENYDVSEIYAGYHTIELEKAINLKAGTRFSVVIGQTSTSSTNVRLELDSTYTGSWYKNVSSAKSGQSFIGVDVNSMVDTSKADGVNCRIKAFTNPAANTGNEDADGDGDGNGSGDNNGDDGKVDDGKDDSVKDDAKEDEKKDETPVNIPITGIGISASSKTVTRGKSFKLTATIAPSDTTDSKAITWKSSDKSIATVSGSGAKAVVKAVSSGKVTITATTSNGKKVSCKVTVQVPAVKVSYKTHVQSYGWEKTYKTNGAMSGTSGESKRLEAIQIKVSGNDKLGIQYVTHCQTYGWLSWSADNEVNGTSGESKRLEAIEIQLTGEDKDKYDVYYRVHAQSYGWLAWAKNGAPAGTAGMSKRLEAIQIIVVRKGESINKNYGGIKSASVLPYVSNGVSQTKVSGADSVHVAYQTHVQSYGWQSWKYDGAMSGTNGESKRIEAINIKLTNKDYSGGITYTTHVQSYGWQSWKSDGAMSGTSGEAKRIEAIRIKLTGEMAKHYDVYYRVYVQGIGWMGWTKNGAIAGTSGYAKRLEGIEIVLVSKGGKSPGSTAGAYKQK